MVNRYDKVIVGQPKVAQTFGGQCPQCGNAFVYEKSDIKFFNRIDNLYAGYIQCPWCEAKPRVIPYIDIDEDDFEDLGRRISVYPHEVFEEGLDDLQSSKEWNKGHRFVTIDVSV
jgi:hypothetical protein